MMEKNGNTFAPGDKVYRVEPDGQKVAWLQSEGVVKQVETESGMVAVDFPGGLMWCRVQELAPA